MITLEQVIISRGDIEKIYRAEKKLTLWRGLHNSEVDNKLNPLYPDFYSKQLPNGDIRAPDVTIIKEGVKEVVLSEEGVGTSLVDKEGIFGYKNWEYFVIPKGTHIPSELIITKDHYMARRNRLNLIAPLILESQRQMQFEKTLPMRYAIVGSGCVYILT